jgi:YD repeat-containing protein
VHYGHVLSYAYNTSGRLVSVTDETGVVLVSYTFTNGRLASVTDRMGHVTRYFYDADGYLQRIELPATQTVGAVVETYATREIKFEYLTLTGTGVPPAGARVLTKITDAEGKATLFSYAFVLSSSGVRTGQGTTTVTDALGNTMRFTYRADGAITQVTGQASTAMSYAYDAAGNLLSVTDRNGFAVANRDTVYYRRLRAELGYVDSATGLGKLVADLTDADKTALRALFTTRYTYDARGILLTSTDNLGNTTTYTYTSFNRIATITLPNGGITAFSYDGKQNLIKQVDPGGDVTRFTYDSFGNLTARVVYLDRADGAKEPADVAADKKQVTAYLYDAFGNNTRTIDAEGFSNSATYDHFGNMLTSTDARGNLSRYTYDADNRLVQLQDASGRKTLFAYDAVGNRIGLTTDWNGHTVTQVFDRNNRLISTIDTALDGNAARTRTTTVGYDDLGNRTRVTDAEGRETTYTYNVRRELVGITSAAVDHDGNPAT